MNRKKLFVIAVLAVIFIGTTTTCVMLSKSGEKSKTNNAAAKADVLVKNAEKGEPEGGYFHYFGVDYPVYDSEQWNIINDELQKTEVRGKDLLNKLGLLTEKQRNCTMEDVRKCLSSLDKDATQEDIIYALNEVAGCFTYAHGSGVVSYFYELSDNTGFSVVFDYVTIDKKNVFISGYGYNADGWDSDWIKEQEALKALTLKDED